jgi:hypothetical protein
MSNSLNANHDTSLDIDMQYNVGTRVFSSASTTYVLLLVTLTLHLAASCDLNKDSKNEDVTKKSQVKLGIEG